MRSVRGFRCAGGWAASGRARATCISIGHSSPAARVSSFALMMPPRLCRLVLCQHAPQPAQCPLPRPAPKFEGPHWCSPQDADPQTSWHLGEIREGGKQTCDVRAHFQTEVGPQFFFLLLFTYEHLYFHIASNLQVCNIIFASFSDSQRFLKLGRF